MHRRFLAVALAAVSLVVVALAAPEVAQSKPGRGQQSEAQHARSQQSVKRRAKHARRNAKRTTRAAKSSRRVATKRIATSTKRSARVAKRSAKTVKPSVKRKTKRMAKRRSRQHAAVSHATRRVHANKPVARAYVATPPDPYQHDPFDYETRTAPVRAVRKTKTVRNAATAAVRELEFGSGWSDVVSEARRWVGTNPTRRRSLWCARFMNFVLERAGHRGTGSDMARSFASYGRRVSGPQVGAIAVMSRGPRGGHVSVVSGIDAKGNPIIISGNHNNRVAEATYPRGRIRAYVMPGS